MSDDAFQKPDADVRIDEALVRNILSEHLPELAGQAVSKAGEGWDNVTMRVGPSHALRLPRRAVADELIRNEQRWLPTLAPHLPLPVPVPLHTGRPTADYPYHWSLVPWLDGDPADAVQPGREAGPALAAFLSALHGIAVPDDAPSNPVRDCGLPAKDEDFHRRLAAVADLLPDATRMTALWARWRDTPGPEAVGWIAGDLHAGNVLVKDGAITAIIDWGDMCAGDPAVDLGAVWTVLPNPQARRAALDLYAPDAPLLRRAAGWALLFSIIKFQTAVGRSERDAVSGRDGYMRLLSDLDRPEYADLLD